MRKPTKAPLTPAQLEIAQLTAAGLSQKEVAYYRHCDVSTVSNTLRHIYAKYGLNNDRELTSFYLALYHGASLEFDVVGKIKRIVSGLILTLIVCFQIVLDGTNHQRVRRCGRRGRYDYELVEFIDLEEE